MCSFPLRCNAACESMCSSSSSSSMAMTMVAPKKGPPARRSRQAQPEKLIPSADRPASPCSQPITHATTITTTTTTQPQTTPKAPSAPKTTKPPRSPQCSRESSHILIFNGDATIKNCARLQSFENLDVSDLIGFMILNDSVSMDSPAGQHSINESSHLLEYRCRERFMRVFIIVVL